MLICTSSALFGRSDAFQTNTSCKKLEMDGCGLAAHVGVLDLFLHHLLLRNKSVVELDLQNNGFDLGEKDVAKAIGARISFLRRFVEHCFFSARDILPHPGVSRTPRSNLNARCHNCAANMAIMSSLRVIRLGGNLNLTDETMQILIEAISTRNCNGNLEVLHLGQVCTRTCLNHIACPLKSCAYDLRASLATM